jgi:hypothetical protein
LILRKGIHREGREEKAGAKGSNGVGIAALGNPEGGNYFLGYAESALKFSDLI